MVTVPKSPWPKGGEAGGYKLDQEMVLGYVMLDDSPLKRVVTLRVGTPVDMIGQFGGKVTAN